MAVVENVVVSVSRFHGIRGEWLHLLIRAWKKIMLQFRFRFGVDPSLEWVGFGYAVSLC